MIHDCDSQQNWSGNENSFLEIELAWKERTLIPVCLENNIFNFYMNREVKSTETNTVNDAEHCLAKNCQQSGSEDGRAVRS